MKIYFYIIGIPKGKEMREDHENLFDKIIHAHFPNLEKDTFPDL